MDIISLQCKVFQICGYNITPDTSPVKVSKIKIVLKNVRYLEREGGTKRRMRGLVARKKDPHQSNASQCPRSARTCQLPPGGKPYKTKNGETFVSP
jgi:hypothetical protein